MNFSDICDYDIVTELIILRIQIILPNGTEGLLSEIPESYKQDDLWVVAEGLAHRIRPRSQAVNSREINEVLLYFEVFKL